MSGNELNKVFGAVTGALTVYVAVGLGAGALFAPKHHAPGEEHRLAFAMPIEDAETEEAEAEPEETMSLAQLVAAADVEAGAKVFKKCQACHNANEEKNGIGPHLVGLLGREIASVGSFTKYSDALQGLDGAWDWAALDGFLTDPKGYAPGTSMGFRGLPKPEDRAAVMTWLNAQSPSPIAPPVE